VVKVFSRKNIEAKGWDTGFLMVVSKRLYPILRSKKQSSVPFKGLICINFVLRTIVLLMNSGPGGATKKDPSLWLA
jgi:hypothetical protein